MTYGSKEECVDCKDLPEGEVVTGHDHHQEKPTHEIGWDLEELSEKIHHLYCAQYLTDNETEYWTGGDYSKLDERTKEYDRNIARFIFSLLTHQKESIVSKLEGLKVGEPYIIGSQTTQEAQSYNKQIEGKEGYNQALADAVEVVRGIDL